MFHRRRSQSGRHPDLTGALKVDARVEVSRVMYPSRVSSSIYMTFCHLKYWSSSCCRVYLFAPREVLSLSLRIGKIDSRAIASSDLQPPESSLSITTYRLLPRATLLSFRTLFQSSSSGTHSHKCPSYRTRGSPQPKQAATPLHAALAALARPLSPPPQQDCQRCLPINNSTPKC